MAHERETLRDKLLTSTQDGHELENQLVETLERHADRSRVPWGSPTRSGGTSRRRKNIVSG